MQINNRTVRTALANFTRATSDRDNAFVLFISLDLARSCHDDVMTLVFRFKGFDFFDHIREYGHCDRVNFGDCFHCCVTLKVDR